MAPLQTGAMNVTSLHIALVSETFPPEVNGVANTLGRLCQGLRERGHRLQLVRPRQADDTAPNDDQLLLTRGWPLPGYPGLQWGQSSLHKLLRRWQLLQQRQTLFLFLPNRKCVGAGIRMPESNANLIPIFLRWHFIRLFLQKSRHQIQLFLNTLRQPGRESLQTIFRSRRSAVLCINGGSVIMRKSNTSGQQPPQQVLLTFRWLLKVPAFLA